MTEETKDPSALRLAIDPAAAEEWARGALGSMADATDAEIAARIRQGAASGVRWIALSAAAATASLQAIALLNGTESEDERARAGRRVVLDALEALLRRTLASAGPRLAAASEAAIRDAATRCLRIRREAIETEAAVARAGDGGEIAGLKSLLAHAQAEIDVLRDRIDRTERALTSESYKRGLAEARLAELSRPLTSLQASPN